MRKTKVTPVWMKILIWITAVITAAYLVSSFIGYANPKNCGFLAISGIAYPLILIAVLASLLFWLVVRRKYALIPAVALLATVPQILAFTPLHYNRFWSGRLDSDFTVMTYNTFGFRGMEIGETNPTVKEILKYDADFVCLQETPRIKRLKQLMDDSQRTLLEKRYPYMGGTDSTSMCYLSKSPVKIIHSYKDNRYFAFCAYETQALGKKAVFINLHLESIGLTPSDKELYMELTSVSNKDKTLRGVRSRLMTKLSNAFKRRAEQAKMVRGYIDSLQTASPGTRIFVCGDFNDTPYSYSYLTIKGNLNDAYTDAGIGPTYTYNANRFYFRIDQLFYEADGIEAVSTRRGNSRSSDHYPIVSIFRKKQSTN